MITQTCYGNVKLLGDGPDLDNVERLDLGALPMINRMADTGLQVDLSHFKKMENILVHDMDDITEKVHTITGHYINLDSGDQVSDLLFKKLGLKQARPKLTTSGDRESVEDEVLKAIQHEHEVIPTILEYKEYSKLLGTYVRPMPKLARKQAFGVWRMYPNFGCTRVPSGRLNCREPNLLAMPNRTDRGREVCEGFITRPGWVYLSVDECLHPSTLVETPLGKIQISDLKVGDVVFSHDNVDRMACSKVTASRQMRSKRAYRITFDNGETVIASHDHRWPTQWFDIPAGKGRKSKIVLRMTSELRVGERMIPWKYHKTGAGYPTIYTQKGSFKSTLIHRIVADAYLGPCPDGNIVHHKDEDKENFHPANLEYQVSENHASIHARANYPNQDHAYRISQLRKGLKGRRSYDGEDNPNSKLEWGDYEAIRGFHLEGYTYQEIAEVYSISHHYVREIIKEDYTSENHQIISIEPCGMQPMWGITVDPHHTYALSCGVVTHNSQIEPRVVAHRSGDINLRNIYFNEEDIYSDFAISAFKLENVRYLCNGFGRECVDRGQRILCDNGDHTSGGSWHYPTVHKKKHRFPAKTCILASIYDVSGKGLSEQMPVVCGNCELEATKHTCGKSYRPLWVENNCQDLINAFYVRYHGILKMRMMDHARVRKHGMVWDEWGRILHGTGVRSVLPWIQSAVLRELANFPIQSTAQGTVKITQHHVEDDFVAMKVYRDIVNPLLQIHDELLFEVREDMADEIGGHVADRFEHCVRLEVPIKANVAKSSNWGSMPK